MKKNKTKKQNILTAIAVIFMCLCFVGAIIATSFSVRRYDRGVSAESSPPESIYFSSPFTQNCYFKCSAYGFLSTPVTLDQEFLLSGYVSYASVGSEYHYIVVFDTSSIVNLYIPTVGYYTLSLSGYSIGSSFTPGAVTIDLNAYSDPYLSLIFLRDSNSHVVVDCYPVEIIFPKMYTLPKSDNPPLGLILSQNAVVQYDTSRYASVLDFFFMPTDVTDYYLQFNNYSLLKGYVAGLYFGVNRDFSFISQRLTNFGLEVMQPNVTNDYNSIYNYGYQQGLSDGQASGQINGYTEGYKVGNADGYNTGYLAGVASSNDYTFMGLIGAVIDAPIKAFTGLFDFEVLGFNMVTFMLSLLTLCVVVKIASMIQGGG